MKDRAGHGGVAAWSGCVGVVGHGLEEEGRTESHARDSEVTALVLQTPAGHGACFVISSTDVDACQFNSTAPAPLVCFVSFERASIVAIYVEALSESDTCIRMNRKPY